MAGKKTSAGVTANVTNNASVTVAKTGCGGRPTAHVTVDAGVSAAALGSILQKVVTSPQVYKLAGLTFCGGCKSGLDINILGGDIREIVQFQV